MTPPLEERGRVISFRDPAAGIIRLPGSNTLIRAVAESYRPDFEHLRASGLLEGLFERRWTVRFDEVPVPAGIQAWKVLQPEPVPFISHGWEWCFSQLKAAALRTLDIHLLALDHGMSLKDATAHNIQWLRGEPVLIDTTSFERLREDRPWVAYRQFCECFLGPLALLATRGWGSHPLMRAFCDGMPLELSASLVPWRARLRPGLFMHLCSHAALARAEALRERKGPAPARGPVRFDVSRHRAIARSLRESVAGLRLHAKASHWTGYYDDCHYGAEAAAAKAAAVAQGLRRLAVTGNTVVWDLGANEGHYAFQAAAIAGLVVAIDSDPACIERNHARACVEGRTNLLPLVSDLVDPSPGRGWASAERASLLDRGPADIAMALAVVHHLVLGAGVPLPEVLRLIRRLVRTGAIVEWVPPDDPQARRLAQQRLDDCHPCDMRSFEMAAAGASLEIIERHPLPRSGRIVCVMKAC